MGHREANGLTSVFIKATEGTSERLNVLSELFDDSGHAGFISPTLYRGDKRRIYPWGVPLCTSG
jgi:hypothetical protein